MIHICAVNQNGIFFCDKTVSVSGWNIYHTEYTGRVFLHYVSADGLAGEMIVGNIFHTEYIWRAFH